MSANDGGPAFPYEGYREGSHEGMSLRDYFAAAALQGVLKDRDNVKQLAITADEEDMDRYKFVAEEMYALADAMLAEREKK